MPLADADGSALTLLVLPATRRDGEVTQRTLAQAGIDCTLCADLRSLSARLGEEGVGAIVITELAFADAALPELLAALERQPPWSEIPALVFTRERGRSPAFEAALAAMSNVTLLDYPSSTRAMVSAAQAALRGRRRQFHMRDRIAAQHEAEAALRDADRRKDEFLATLAHELRNPLATVVTGITLLTRRPEDRERALRTLGMMDRQSRLLVKLIDDLLDVSRIATGKLVLQREPVDLRAVVEAALETSRAVLTAQSHDVRVAMPAHPVMVSGDMQRLGQAVGNLLSNAAKYTPARGRIEVTLAIDADEARLDVADSGVGIPAEMLGQVFELFAQVNQTLDRSQGGLGIGLSLVRRLIELHGGSVSGTSAGIGRGSTFGVRLPLLAASAAEAPADAAAGAAPAQRLLRVLVIDDNADVADSLAALVGEAGHETRIAYDGPAGLAANDAFRADVVFCDIGLPGMSGHEVAARLRADPRNTGTTLVAVTGWGNDDDRQRTAHAGFDLHLTKPVSAEAIDQVLARA